MFPDIKYKANGPDEEQRQVFDCNDGEDVYKYILRLFDGASKKWKETYGFKVGGNMLPTKEDTDYIASLLRGDFDRGVAMSVNIRYSEEALIKLTDEQYRCIDQLDGNKRCLIEGGAGTGKTLLAVKEAQKAVASGLRVALFCFNRNLSEWLNMRFEDVPDDLTPEFIGTFHSYMSKVCRDGKIGFDDVDDFGKFYAELLPRGASMALDKLDDEKFDKIIVDEAQDLINDSYLDVLDKCLRGGLSKGRWTFMGDFSQQAIYNDKKLTGDEMKELIEERAPFAGFRLTVNCRNTRPICDEISLITGFQAPGDVLSEVEGTPVRYITYSDQKDEKKKLRDTVKKLIKDNIPPEKITILSPVKRENSVVSKIEDITINDYDPKAAENGEVTFCTVQSFKGLENTVIILADIDSLKNRQLMYVALSRARSGLYIIGSEQALGEYEELVKNRAEKDGRLKEKQGTVV